MPYGVFGNNSVMDEWNKSAFNQARDNEAQAAMAEQQKQLLASIPQGYSGNIDLANRPVVQNPDGSVSTVRSMSFNEDGKEILVPTISQSGANLTPQQAIDEYHRTGQHLGVFNSPEAANAMAQQIHNQQAQMVAPTRMTQIAEQGAMPRKPTSQEYEAHVINYLMNKGYDFDEAQQLMMPKIQMYRMQEANENRQKADALAAQLDQLPIDSNEYRAGALQLYRLDPQIGGLYLKDGIGRRELYMQDRNRANKREDMQYNADFQLRNALRRMDAQEAYKIRQMETKYNLLVKNGVDPQQARYMVLGLAGRGNNANGANNGGVKKEDYDWAEKTIASLDEKLDGMRANNPNAQLSAQDIQMYNDAVTIRNWANQQRVARYGLGGQQQQQKTKIDVNNYSVLKKMIQDTIAMNGGKFDKNVAMAVRKRAGLDPNNTNPNEWINEIFDREYKYRG